MHYVPQPLSFRWDQDFVDRIDAARGDVSRSLWVRRAVEDKLALEAKIHPDAISRRKAPRAAQDPPRPVESPQKGSQGPTGQVTGRSEAELNRLQWLAAQQKARSR